MPRNFAVCFLLVWCFGCSSSTPSTEPTTAPRAHHLHPSIGKNYAVVRQALIADGWKPIQARCSPQNLCFDYPEQATNMRTAATCGAFAKGTSTLRICVDVISDGMLVKSVQNGR
jgi:hypothetical protein